MRISAWASITRLGQRRCTHLNGLIDDVRVYNYALPLHDEPEYDSISKLTAMGGLVAKVDAGEDIVFNWKPGVKTTVAAIITDLGAPNPMTILWSTESGPGEAEFDDPMSMTTGRLPGGRRLCTETDRSR